MRRIVDYARATLLLAGVVLGITSVTEEVEAVTCWGTGHNCHIQVGSEIAHHLYYDS